MQRKRFLRLRERYVRRGKQLVHVDECGFVPTITRRYAYAPKGRRVYGLTAGHRRPRTSLIAARRDEGFPVPCLFEGPCETEVFNCWLDTMLCPRLTDAHVVIMDNAAVHQSPETARLIEQAGSSLLFLSPYSPDFNPIEKDFAAIKKNREYNEHDTLDAIVKNYQ